MTDAELARELAHAAGMALLAVRARAELTGRALMDAGDRTAQDVIADLLARRRPQDAVLSEEAPDSPARLTADRVWIIDPLDGTREFGQRPRTDWAVHIALWDRHGGVDGMPALVAAAVGLPDDGVVLDAETVSPPPGGPSGPPRLVVSRTRPPAVLPVLVEALGAQVEPMGSAGAKTMAVVTGAADAYLHAGGLREWDAAAPVGVALAAGLHVSRLDGRPVTFNHPDPVVGDLLVARPGLATRLLAVLRARGGAILDGPS